MLNMNKALLTKCWWNLLSHPNKPINQILKEKTVLKEKHGPENKETPPIYHPYGKVYSPLKKLFRQPLLGARRGE